MYNLDRLVSKNLVDGLPTLKFEKDRVCDACQKGKQIKIVSLELLHMDLFGPSRTMNIGGNYYGLAIVDDYSRFTWTLFILTNDHAFTVFKELAKVSQNENNNHIYVIKFDHGREFQNERFKHFCNKHGTKHNFPLQEPHSKNGVVEEK